MRAVVELAGGRREGARPRRDAREVESFGRRGELIEPLDELLRHADELERKDHGRAQLPQIARVDFEVHGHVVEIELVDGVLE